MSIKCNNCGCEVEIPEKIQHAADRWEHKLKVEAERKAAIRKKDPKYCQVKRNKE
jgi:hypothetical protein